MPIGIFLFLKKVLKTTHFITVDGKSNHILWRETDKNWNKIDEKEVEAPEPTCCSTLVGALAGSALSSSMA